jgi:hypothetical protein
MSCCILRSSKMHQSIGVTRRNNIQQSVIKTIFITARRTLLETQKHQIRLVAELIVHQPGKVNCEVMQ